MFCARVALRERRYTCIWTAYPVADSVAQNWILFYALLSRHTTEMYPIIYTPTEADAIQSFSHLFRRPEGLFLVPPYEAQMEDDFLSACDGRELDLVCLYCRT
jgi:malic enzyme